MPNVSELKTSKYLTKHDVETPILVTIKGYKKVNVAGDGQDPDVKYVLLFHETDKPLVLNVTNGNIIHSITGSDDFDDWIGHKIVLYNDPNISFGGKLTGGIRARKPKNQPARPAPAPAPRRAPAPPQSVGTAAFSEETGFGPDDAPVGDEPVFEVNEEDLPF